MKKLIALGIALVMVLAISVTAHAASDPKNIGITLNVNEVFGLLVQDESDQDQTLAFGLLNEGDIGGGILLCTCGTNQGNPWILIVKGEDLTNALADQSITVNNITFTTYAGGGDAGVGTYASSVTPMSTSDNLAYVADVSEHSDTWVTVMMGIQVYVPYGTVTDSYSGDVIITMVEY